jgi:hypothetical protein
MLARPGLSYAHRARTAHWQADLAPWRWLGAAMVTLGATLPHIAHSPGLPCPLRTMTGVPCPLCGMTTSVKAVCTGRLREGVVANPFGLLAVAVALLLVARPRWRSARLPVAPILMLVAMSWTWELRRFGWI